MMHPVKLVFAFILLIQLQLTAAKPQREKEIGTLQTLELKHPELPINKRVELALIDWNKNNNNCSGHAFWYMEQCNPLNDVSKFCESINDFIVLEKPNNTTTNSYILKPVCKEHLCRYDRISQEVRKSFKFMN